MKVTVIPILTSARGTVFKGLERGQEKLEIGEQIETIQTTVLLRAARILRREMNTLLYFDLRPGPKILFQGNTPEGSDTFQRQVIERDRVGGLRLMIWDKVKVTLCHYSHAPEESNL